MGYDDAPQTVREADAPPQTAREASALPEKEVKAEEIEAWREETDWIHLCSHHELISTAREVILEYTSTLLGREKRVRIPHTGIWVWKPDASEILRLGQLASCRGPDTRIDRPFFTCQASNRAMRDKPNGPPTG